MKNEKIILDEKSLWGLVENLNWSQDHDYKRIEGELKGLGLDVANQIHEFVSEKRGEICSQYQEDWLGEPGIGVSDDGWSDLTNDIVGRGRKVFENINTKQLQEIADSGDYYENFGYSFQFLYD
tara:strand:- start:131 stop:502 length:372 start_codon:yes stop_codon:yes gene_type:complete